jgi:Holliday junction DNA helicase RuvA
MITKITGIVNRVLEEEVRLQVGAFEYQVLVPEFVRRAVQTRVGKELTFHTTHYFDGDPSRGKVVPRLVGFLAEVELEFFELFCTVDRVGVRKALGAMVRPVKDIADAIGRQDAKWLSTLPGVGAQTAEKIIATLRRKVTRFTLAPARTEAPAASTAETAPAAEEATPVVVNGNVFEDAYQALLSLGNSPLEARNRLDKVFTAGRTFSTVEEVLLELYKQT